ncbi:MAG: hypothetical protein ACI8QS_002239 [Planctomycetota bacterium]|jgi:hypothetical protein
MGRDGMLLSQITLDGLCVVGAHVLVIFLGRTAEGQGQEGPLPDLLLLQSHVLEDGL